MRSLQGKPFNISKPIIGRVTWGKCNPFSRRTHILIAKGLTKKFWFYDGFVSNEVHAPVRAEKVPGVYGLNPDELNALKEGDVLLLEPDGRVNVVWEIDSPHNAILATEDCNCSCIMCPQPRRRDRAGLFERNLKLLSLIDRNRTSTLGITGGEPTLLGEGLLRLIAACKKYLPKASILLLSNGRAFSKIDYAEKLVAINHPDLTICIPLYADTDNEHDRIVGVNGSFYEAIKGIHNLALFRQKIEIRNVMLSLNFMRLPQYAEFIYRNFPFAIHVALMGLEAIGLARRNLDEIWVDPTEYVPELRQAVSYLNRADMHVSIYNLQLCILPHELWRFCRKSISLWKNVFLEQCEGCDYMQECGGFFGTSGGWHSKYVKPLKRS